MKYMAHSKGTNRALEMAINHTRYLSLGHTWADPFKTHTVNAVYSKALFWHVLFIGLIPKFETPKKENSKKNEGL